MKITAWISIAIALSALEGQAAAADPIARNHGINQRQENQKDHVQQGVKRGESAKKETRKQTQEAVKSTAPASKEAQ